MYFYSKTENGIVYNYRFGYIYSSINESKNEISYYDNLFFRNKNKFPYYKYNYITGEEYQFYENTNVIKEKRDKENNLYKYYENGSLKLFHNEQVYKLYNENKKLQIHTRSITNNNEILENTDFLVWKNKDGISLIPPKKGKSFTMYKICYNHKCKIYVYVQLFVFADSERLFTCEYNNDEFHDHKIRVDKCKVVKIFDKKGFIYDSANSFVCNFSKNFTYKTNEIVSTYFDPNPKNICSFGIHGFMTVEECDRYLPNHN
jgi:hypothetical protein